MIDEKIAPRRPYWADYLYDSRLNTRHLRQWRRQIGYGEARFMSGSIREEFIKCFEQYVHLTSGLGEAMQHEVVSRYFRMHPDRRYIETDYRDLREPPHMSAYSDSRALPKHRLPR